MTTKTRTLALVALVAACGWTAGCGDGSSTVADDAGGDDVGADADADGDAGEDADAEATDAEADAPSFDPDPERILDDIEFLAGPDCAGRDPGTPGNETALAFVEARFRDLGLEPAGDDGTYRHRFELPLWSLSGPPTVSLDGVELRHGEDYDVFYYSPAAAALSGPAVFVGYGLVVPPFDPAEYPSCPLDPGGYDDYAGVDVTDAVVVMMFGLPRNDSSVRASCPVSPKAEAAASRGAIGAVVTPHGDMRPSLIRGFFASGLDDYTPALDTIPAIPMVYLSGAAATASFPTIAAAGAAIDTSFRLGTYEPQPEALGVTATLTFECHTVVAEADNVIGSLPGTDPAHDDEVVLVGAHFDHLGTNETDGTIYPGANDNASGAAMMLELARGVAEGVSAPARTMLFAAWNAEERGAFGSCGYVARPSRPLASTLAAFNIEKVGAPGLTGLLLSFGDVDPNVWLADLLRARRDEARLMAPISTDLNPGSDHHCFVEEGVPVLAVWGNGSDPYYHSPLDTADRIDVDSLRLAARLLWGALEPLARATEAAYLE